MGERGGEGGRMCDKGLRVHGSRALGLELGSNWVGHRFGANAHRGVELNCQIQQITGFVTFDATREAEGRGAGDRQRGRQGRW